MKVQHPEHGTRHLEEDGTSYKLQVPYKLEVRIRKKKNGYPDASPYPKPQNPATPNLLALKLLNPKPLLLMDKSCMTLRTLNYGNYGIFLIMGNAGFCPSAVVPKSCPKLP